MGRSCRVPVNEIAVIFDSHISSRYLEWGGHMASDNDRLADFLAGEDSQGPPPGS